MLRPGLIAGTCMAGLIVASCSPMESDGPRLDSISPSWAPPNTETPATLSGNFKPDVIVSYDEDSHSQVSTSYRVQIGGLELDATYVDDSTLDVTVPASLPEGAHEVTVSDPRGRSSSLSNGFIVGTGGSCDYLDSTAGVCAGGGTLDGSGVCSIPPPNYEADEASCSDGSDNDCDGVIDETTALANWWDPSWQYRRQLTLDNSAQAQALDNFPVLVVLRSSQFDYAGSANAGDDLRFLDADHTTVLAHHVEHWDAAGDSFIWVRVPTIDASSASDSIWLYYGNDAATPAVDEAGTYGAGFTAVWHLDETSGPHVDSASGISCVWLGGGGGTQDAVGHIGGASEFDGVEDSADCGLDPIPDSVEHTITAWVNLPLTGDVEQEILAYENLGAPYSGIGLYVHRNDGAVGKWLGSGYHYASTPDQQVAANTWAFVAIRGRRANPGGVVEVSRDGGPWEAVVSGNTNNLAVPASTPLIIGKWTGGGPNASARGRIDEVRMSNIMRSDEWIRAEFLSGSDTFISYGARQEMCN